jgi:hypothetical protein
MKQAALLGLGLLCMSAAAQSTDYQDLFSDIEQSTPAESAGASTPDRIERVSLQANHEVRFALPVVGEHDDFAGAQKAPQLTNTFELGATRGAFSLRAALQGRLRLSQGGSADELISLQPLENSMSYSTSLLRATLGYQYYSWGSADKLNPTDNLNPRDYTSGPDAEKLPLFSLSATLYPTSRVAIGGVYAPYEQSDLFPLSAPEQIPAELFSTIRFATIALSPSGVQPSTRIQQESVSIVQTQLPFEPTSFIAGGRVQLFGSVFDMSVSYLYDFDQYYSPRLTLEHYTFVNDQTTISSLLPDSVRHQMASLGGWGLSDIELYRSRIQRIGVDAKKIIGRAGVWGELCYSLGEDHDNSDPAVRNDQLSWTAGMDISYGPADEHYLNIQHVGSWIVDYDKTVLQDYSQGAPDRRQLDSYDYMYRYYSRLLSQPLARQSEGALLGAAVRSEWSMVNNRFKPSIEALMVVPRHYDKTQGRRYGDGIGRITLQWLPEDAVTVSVGGELFYAAIKRRGESGLSNFEDSRIGLYYPDSRVFVQATYAWAR